MANINETICEVEKLNPELARQLKKVGAQIIVGSVRERLFPFQSNFCEHIIYANSDYRGNLQSL